MFNFQVLVKYLLEGMAVALAAFYIPQRKVEVKEIVLISLTAAAVFSILDQFTPSIGTSARQGAGFGIGLNQVGWGSIDGGATQEEKVSCSCEVDADVLKQKLCKVHSSTAAPARPPSSNTSAPESLGSVSQTAGESDDGVVGDKPVEPFDGFMKHF